MDFVRQQVEFHNIDKADRIEMFDAFKNHFDHTHNEKYAKQLINYIDNG